MSNQTHLDWSFYRSKYKRKTESDKVEMIWNTVEAVVRGHPWDAKKVSVTGAGSLRECQNTDFVWSWEKWCFGKVAISRAFRLRECRLGELPLYVVDERTTDATFTIIICINMSTVSSDAGIQECHWQRLSWFRWVHLHVWAYYNPPKSWCGWCVIWLLLYNIYQAWSCKK